MFIPAPTEANTAMFPASNWCPSSLPFRIRFNNVGIVATDEFPRFEMVIGMIEHLFHVDDRHGISPVQSR